MRSLAVAVSAFVVAVALAVALLAGSSPSSPHEPARFEGISRSPLNERTYSREAAENRRLARARARAIDEAALRSATAGH